MNLNISGGDIINGVIVIGIASLVLRNNHNESQKRKDVYKKIESVDKDAEKKFVDKDVCKVTHEGVQRTLDEINGRTECMPAIKAGMDLLLKKNGLQK